MTIDELKALSRSVYKRIGELDKEQCKVSETGGWRKNTRYRGDIVKQAAEELIGDPSWRPVVTLICEGALYYGLCEEWFEDIT